MSTVQDAISLTAERLLGRIKVNEGDVATVITDLSTAARRKIAEAAVRGDAQEIGATIIALAERERRKRARVLAQGFWADSQLNPAEFCNIFGAPT